jgi:hypothetical protein
MAASMIAARLRSVSRGVGGGGEEAILSFYTDRFTFT